MIFKEIYEGRNLYLFAPYDNEYLYNYIQHLGYDIEDASKDWRKRLVVLSVIKSLMELDIIYIHNWCNNSQLNDMEMTIDETLSHINELWKKDSKFPDFYAIVMFGTKKWYSDKLHEMGLTQVTDWNQFLNANIPDLKLWIEENKPK